MSKLLVTLVLLVPSAAFAIDCPLDCDALAGDVNGDASVNIGDQVTLMGFLAGHKYVEICDRGADINADGAVDVADLSVLAEVLWQPGAAVPVDPACDFDPGDVNGDGQLDIGDVIAIDGYLE